MIPFQLGGKYQSVASMACVASAVERDETAGLMKWSMPKGTEWLGTGHEGLAARLFRTFLSLLGWLPALSAIN
jgi:hypothetical protein